MTLIKNLILFILYNFISTSYQFAQKFDKKPLGKATAAHFYLSAFGVESDGFPTIDANINFQEKKSLCNVTYYEPWNKPKSYKLSIQEIDTLQRLISSVDWVKFQKEFSVNSTDQPTSTLMLNINDKNFEIKDYGLEGDSPLPELYRIVYKLNKNFH